MLRISRKKGQEVVCELIQDMPSGSLIWVSIEELSPTMIPPHLDRDMQFPPDPDNRPAGCPSLSTPTCRIVDKDGKELDRCAFRTSAIIRAEQINRADPAIGARVEELPKEEKASEQ